MSPTSSRHWDAVVMLVAAFGVGLSAADVGEPHQGPIVQYGTMHEAIAQQQHEGRVSFGEVVKRPHFYGVAALEGLRGEATILDGKVTMTTVDVDGRMQPIEGPASDKQATLLVGAYVSSWSKHAVSQDVGAGEFDSYIADAAGKAGMRTSEPFLFTIEGEFTDVRLHVINGACPMHARLKDVELPKEQQPFASVVPRVKGTLVGVFAKDAVGKLTHPATSTHDHLLFEDPATGKTATGHVERVGLRAGSVVRFPQS